MAKRQTRTELWLQGDGGPRTVPAGTTNEWGGNLRSEGRPVLLRRDPLGLIEGYSTTSSTIVPLKGGGYAVVPTVVDGKDIGETGAYRHFRETGEYWGRADTISGAEDIADSVHERHAELNFDEWNAFASSSLSALSPELREGISRAIRDERRGVGYEGKPDAGVPATQMDAYGGSTRRRTGAIGGRANVRPRLTASMRANSARFAAGWYQDAQGNWVDPGRKKSVDPGRMPFGGSLNARAAEAEMDRAAMNRFLLTSSAPMIRDGKGRVVGVGGGIRTDNAGPNIGVNHWGDLSTGRERQAAYASKVEADASAARRAEALRQQRKAAAEARVAEAPAVDLSKLTVDELTQTARNIRNFNDPGHARRTNQANAAARSRDPYGAAHLVDFSSTDPAKLKRQAARNMQSLIEKRQVTKVAGIEQPGIVKTWDTAASAVKTLQTVKAPDLAAEGAKRAGTGTARLDALTARADKSIGKTNARISRIDEKMAKLRESLAEFDKMAAGWETKADRTASTANPVGVTAYTGVLAPIPPGVRGSGSGRPRELGRQVVGANGELPGGMATPRIDVGRIQPELTGSSREDNLREAMADEEARRAQRRPRNPEEAAIFAGRTKRSSRASLLGGSVATGPRTTSGPRTSGIGIRSFAPDFGASSVSPVSLPFLSPGSFRGSTWTWTRANGMMGSAANDDWKWRMS